MDYSYNKEDEEKYISQWTLNAKQHFEDGDYEWICSHISGEYHKILELGCGTGYSTLAFLLKDFEVLSLDLNEECIKSAKKLIEMHDYIVGMAGETNKADVLLWKVDIVHGAGKITRFAKENFPVDLIVLCNPGGQLTQNITKKEYELLKICGFLDNEISGHINMGNVALLHKWAMIYAACSISINLERPLLIIDRGSSKEDVRENLEQIAKDTEIRLINSYFRKINDSPEGGVKIVDRDGKETTQVWGAGLYFPQ